MRAPKNSDNAAVSIEDGLTIGAIPASSLPLATVVSAHDRAFVAKHIFAEQVRLLFQFSLVGYLAELMVTLLLGAILWNDIGERPELFVWFIAAGLVIVGRYVLYKLFIRANPSPDALSTWETRFVIGSLLMAALWGVILGFPVLRLRGDYLAIVTLGFGEIVRILLLNNTQKVNSN